MDDQELLDLLAADAAAEEKQKQLKAELDDSLSQLNQSVQRLCSSIKRLMKALIG